MPNSYSLTAFNQHRQVALRIAHAAKPAIQLMGLLVLQIALTDPAIAQTTEVWTKTATSLLAEFNAVLRPLSVIAIIVMGLAAGFGKMEWGLVAKVGAGIIVANGATTIVDFLTTNGGGSST